VRRCNRCFLAIFLACSVLGVLPGRAADDDAFEIKRLQTKGRTVAVSMADVDGDGRKDLVQASIQGVPPDEKRELLVYLQTASGDLPGSPSFRLPVPEKAAAYDIADLRPTPGEEFLFLEPRGVRILSLSKPAEQNELLEIKGATTVGAAKDERGLEHFKLVWEDLGNELRIVVPLFGETAILAANGEESGRLETGARANYFIPAQPSLNFLESDIQLFFDSPHLLAGDVDGDGRRDLVAANRHELGVFLQQPDGRFPREPSRRLFPRLVNAEDHMRGSGGVAAELQDVDGDGKADLLISHIAGNFTEARTETYLYLNRDGSFDFGSPTRSFVTESSLGADLLIDIDGDGRPEMIRGGIPFGVFELVEALVTQAIDVNLEVYRYIPGKGLEKKPSQKLKLDIPINFDTMRPEGFIARAHSDLNGDGTPDFLRSGGGDAIEVYLGGTGREWRKRSASQPLDTEGIARVDDWNGDGLNDVLIFDPSHEDAVIRLAINRGLLPGSPPSMRAAPKK